MKQDLIFQSSRSSDLPHSGIRIDLGLADLLVREAAAVDQPGAALVVAEHGDFHDTLSGGVAAQPPADAALDGAGVLGWAALEAATPAHVAPLRTVRLATDRAEADAKLDGPALWRRSEPGNSAELAEALAADLVKWSRICAGS